MQVLQILGVDRAKEAFVPTVAVVQHISKVVSTSAELTYNCCFRSVLYWMTQLPLGLDTFKKTV